MARYMVYTVAPVEGLHDILIELDDCTIAETPVGADGGATSVVAVTAGVDNADAPPISNALIS